MFSFRQLDPALILCPEISQYEGELGAEGDKGVSSLWPKPLEEIDTHCLFIVCFPVFLSWGVD